MKIRINNFYITLKVSFILIFLLMIALGYIEQFFIIYFFIVIHEVIHILTARIWGRTCRGIIIMPMGLCADIDQIENTRLSKRNVIILSAPLFNVLIGIVFKNSFIGKANIVIGIFNLIPIYPLDGARFLQNTAGYFIGTLRANKVVAISSKIFIAMIFISGVFQVILFNYDFTIIIVSLYLYRESKRFDLNRAFCFYKCLIKNKSSEITKIKLLWVDKNTCVKDIIYKLGMDYYTLFYINGKLVNEDEIKNYINKYGLNVTISGLLRE